MQDAGIGPACNPAFCRCVVPNLDWFTIMRSAFVLVVALLLMSAAAGAEPPKLAVFDLEMIDTSLQGEVEGLRADEQARLLRTGDQVRKELAESGRFLVLDIAPVNAAAHGSNLQACGGCDVKLAGELGADLAMTGVVQKVSNLILNINLYLRDVHSGQLVAAASADMRGNTDESWSRATDYLVRNRLLAPNYGAPQAR
ncbi:hypothetical protein M2222_000024 [Bradyrhizobium elkanii]|nr:hypothetical protein [Bradyrhizobium elkanii]MCS3557702.1 hypothetical protein [Bradyrhizobium elkanii]MCW2152450.1 hypothetical protein [Bradyrhizobium elkanii]MCW2357673.1 hypothetical protein [Bradyrhizobium elkanii]MCW2376180.1 hypothetical protein [Bradyrhizobium elkanii]